MSNPLRRVAKGSSHHPWISRDYYNIDCQSVGCKFNLQLKCMVPSRCNIGPQGNCEGFVMKETPKELDGD